MRTDLPSSRASSVSVAGIGRIRWRGASPSSGSGHVISSESGTPRGLRGPGVGVGRASLAGDQLGKPRYLPDLRAGTSLEKLGTLQKASPAPLTLGLYANWWVTLDRYSYEISDWNGKTIFQKTQSVTYLLGSLAAPYLTSCLAYIGQETPRFAGGVTNYLQQQLNAKALQDALRKAFDAACTGVSQIGIWGSQAGSWAAEVVGLKSGAGARAAARRPVIATARATLERPGRKLVKLNLTKLGKRLFRQTRRLRVGIVVRFKPNDGLRVIARRTATLRR